MMAVISSGFIFIPSSHPSFRCHQLARQCGKLAGDASVDALVPDADDDTADDLRILVQADLHGLARHDFELVFEFVLLRLRERTCRRHICDDDVARLVRELFILAHDGREEAHAALVDEQQQEMVDVLGELPFEELLDQRLLVAATEVLPGPLL